MNYRLFLLISIAIITNSTHCAGRVFLENQYGSPIIYKVSRQTSVITNPSDKRRLEMMQPQFKELKLNPGVRVLLGLIPTDTHEQLLWVNDINIKPESSWSVWSQPFISLTPTLNDITDSGIKLKTKDQDVIIMIHPPRTFGATWHVSFRFEKPTTVIAW